MRKKLVFWGAVLTAGYLLVIAAIVVCKLYNLPEFKLDDLKLNELGDFLAGVFGPLGFLWVVLGFLQQGEELRISSEALQLQAAELKESVLQQSAMVNVAKLQLEEDIRRSNEARENSEKAVSPKLKLKVSGDERHLLGGLRHIKFEVSNDGMEIYDVKGKSILDGKDMPTVIVEKIMSNSVNDLMVNEDMLKDGRWTEIKLTYCKKNYTDSSTSFFVRMTVGGRREYQIENAPY